MKSLFQILGIIFLILPKYSLTQDSLVYRTFLEGRIQLKVPMNFRELSQAEIKEEFPNLEIRPSVVLRDSVYSTSLKIVLTQDKVSDKEVGQYKGWRISRMLKDTSMKVVSHDYIDVNARKVGVIRVIYPQKAIYSHYFFTSLAGELVLVILECEEHLKVYSEKTFDKIMRSLVIKSLVPEINSP